MAAAPRAPNGSVTMPLTLPFVIGPYCVYSHLLNKRGGGAKVAKSLNVEAGINVEPGHVFKNH